MVEEGGVVEERVSIYDRVVRRHWVVRDHWAVVVCHGVFVLSRCCQWMVAHHRGR